MLNKNNYNEIVENITFYKGNVIKFKDFIESMHKYSQEHIISELKQIFEGFKLSLPITDRLELGQLKV